MCRHGFGRVSSTTAPLVLILTGQVQQAGEGEGSILLGINVAMPVLLGSPVPRQPWPNAVAGDVDHMSYMFTTKWVRYAFLRFPEDAER